MKFKYGTTSRERLNTADARLQEIFDNVLDLGLIDVSILTGERDQPTQDALFEKGLYKLKWHNSKHNRRYGERSKAVDAAPYVNGAAS